MQLNVMPWLTVGWALVLLAARHRWGKRGLHGSRRSGPAARLHV